MQCTDTTSFDYICTSWFPNLSKKLRLRLQATQKKYMTFCLQLYKMSIICAKEILKLNLLNPHYRFQQSILSDNSKFFNSQFRDYFNEVFNPVDDNLVARLTWNRMITLQWNLGTSEFFLFVLFFFF